MGYWGCDMGRALGMPPFKPLASRSLALWQQNAALLLPLQIDRDLGLHPHLQSAGLFVTVSQLLPRSVGGSAGT